MTRSKSPRLKRQVLSPNRGHSNQWWYKLTAFSFIVKVVLVLGLVLTIKFAADAARADEERLQQSQETATPPASEPGDKTAP